MAIPAAKPKPPAPAAAEPAPAPVQAPVPAASSGPTGAAAAEGGTPPASLVERLTAMGFPEDAARQALEATKKGEHYDADEACSILLASA